MSLLACIILTAAQANVVAKYTASGARIEPTPIAAGPNAGSYCVPDRVLSDAPWAARRAVLAKIPIVTIDTDVAWPVPSETTP